MKNEDLFTILVVDDEQTILDLVTRFFSKHPYHVITADSGERGLKILEEKRVDLLLLDLRMPGMDGLAVLKKAKEMDPDLKVIIQTGYGGVNEAVEAIKNGASDYLEKGGSLYLMGSRVELIFKSWEKKRKRWDGVDRREYQFNFDKMVGESMPMTRLKDLIVRVAATDTTVNHSERRGGPFVVVDCASISETVIESELFGHEKGAFTGADTTTLGLVRSANKGTLFLDEIGELSLSVQAKLLRVIQEQTIRPVGSIKNYDVDLRIIAATHRNLLDEIEDNQFRQDLYYRLSTVTLTVPPLRERGSDISLLSNHIVEQNSPDETPIEISEQARMQLTKYEWPGNVRELENVLRGALVFANDGVITPEDLSPPIGECVPVETDTSVKPGTLASYELEAIRNALTEAENNRRKAAAILDISETTLYRKIKQYNL